MSSKSYLQDETYKTNKNFDLFCVEEIAGKVN